MQQLAQKIAVITGGGRGIGAGIARALAALGASVVVCGRTQSHLEDTARTVRSAGGQCQAQACNVADWNSVSALAEHVHKTHGRLDILVNNAGVASFGQALHRTSLDAWDSIMNTNLRGVFYTIRAFTPLLIAAGGGHVVNISSIASKNALPNGAAYAASKWGLNGLSYSAAEELRGHNIRVSVVCPGSTNTELSPHEGKDPGKMLQPDDIGHVVGMLVTQSPNSFASEVVIRPTMKP
jgi:3-oxoacyl-[acyl-carrier protein] reductase